MAIFVDEQNKTFYLENDRISFVLWVNPIGLVEQVYFGSRIGHDYIPSPVISGGGAHMANCILPDGSAYNPDKQRFAVHTPCGGDFGETSLEVVFANGTRRFEPVYRSHRILNEKPRLTGLPACRGGETLEITTEAFGVTVVLSYSVFPDCDTVQTSMRIKNTNAEPVRLNRAYSFALHLPPTGEKWDAFCLRGYTRHECMPERSPLGYGVFSTESRRGMSSAVSNPTYAVMSHSTTETHGTVYGVNLIYSGSFRLAAELSSNEWVRMTGGIQDNDFSWKLEQNEEFCTPEAVLVWSDTGLGGMSRALHTLFREHLIAPQFVKKPHPIVVNNWEGTSFDCFGDRLRAIAEVAAGRGIDTFVLDDGWFGARNDSSAGLGDWVVNEEKIGGMKSLIDFIHERGMRFGLWFEPEMVNPDSDLYRAHPDWAMHSPGSEPRLSRNQMFLDLTRQDVRDYVVESVNKILDTYEIDYVKWDANRDQTECWSELLPADRQQEVQHRQVLGLYDLFERIVAAHPNVFFEGCASGGSRFDAGILYWFPQIWASDNSCVFGRERIQYGTSMAYPLSSISCHVARAPSHHTNLFAPWKTRASLAMLGSYGYEMDLSKADPADVEGIAAETKEYRDWQDVVLTGDAYRLLSPFGGTNIFAMQIVSKDKKRAKLTAIREIFHVAEPFPTLYPQGLEPDTAYFVPELGKTCLGRTWMHCGLPFKVDAKADFADCVYRFIAE